MQRPEKNSMRKKKIYKRENPVEIERKEWERRKGRTETGESRTVKVKKIDLSEIEDDDERFKVIARQEFADTTLRKMDSKMMDGR
jgi:hypothetical protein